MDNAAPNSEVGKIAAYKDLAAAAQAADKTVVDAQAALDAEVAAANLDGVVDPAEQATIDGLTQDLNDAKATAATTDADAQASLESAANKTLTDEVIGAVNDALGL